MLYCENCMYLAPDAACPSCGRKKLREPRDSDPVYLITKDAIIAASIEDILIQNGIPCLKKGLIGAGITSRIGFTNEVYRFFVPFGAYGKAKELLDNFFDEEGKEK